MAVPTGCLVTLRIPFIYFKRWVLDVDFLFWELKPQSVQSVKECKKNGISFHTNHPPFILSEPIPPVKAQTSE